MAVTLKGGDRFDISWVKGSTLGLISVRRARKTPEGKWATMNLVIRPKEDLRHGVLASFRHYRQVMDDALKFNAPGNLRPTATSESQPTPSAVAPS